MRSTLAQSRTGGRYSGGSSKKWQTPVLNHETWDEEQTYRIMSDDCLEFQLDDINMNIETFGKDTRTSFYTGSYLRMILFTCKRRMEPSSEGTERLPATTCTSGFAAALPKSPRLPFRSERKIHKYWEIYKHWIKYYSLRFNSSKKVHQKFFFQIIKILIYQFSLQKFDQISSDL